jgi:DNA-binding PadR family transcriptional regulator
MTQSELIKKIEAFTEENKIDYDQLSEELKALEKNGYLYIEPRSMPNYFLTPLAVEAIEVTDLIETEVVMSLAKEFKDTSLNRSDIEKRVKKDIGSFLP